MSKYLVISTAVIDQIHLSNGEYVGDYLGGAGIYALCGLRIWCDDVTLITGIGSDFLPSWNKWFIQNRCSTAGLYECDPCTPHTDVRYLQSGQRIDTPLLGKEHYKKMEADTPKISHFLEDATGVYIFQEIPSNYWDSILEHKKKHNFKLEWELNDLVACPSRLEEVRKIACQCDIFSLNHSEAQSLLAVSDTEFIIADLKNWDVPMIFLRLGSDGSIIIRNQSITKIPSISCGNVIDPTGAGNSSSAAVLYGYCENYNDYQCGILGSISAAKCIEQFGPPDLSRMDRDELLALLNQISSST